MKRKRPNVEDLAFPTLVGYYDELERMSAHEAETSQALTPLQRALVDRRTGGQLLFAAMARTASLFLVDYFEFRAAIMSAGPDGLYDLPPLPYPRIAVECAENRVWELRNGWQYDLELFFINEAVRGEKWEVCLLMVRDNPTLVDVPRRTIGTYTLYGDGSVDQDVGFGNRGPSRSITTREELAAEIARDRAEGGETGLIHFEPGHPNAEMARRIPIEFAHLANARGVTVEEVAVHRSQRRRFARKKLIHPQVYFVYIDDEVVDSHPGHGDREYHCRWMVRGHWRHYTSGKSVWVRPYIKGPAGAPWKGRPIYVMQGGEERERRTA